MISGVSIGGIGGHWMSAGRLGWDGGRCQRAEDTGREGRPCDSVDDPVREFSRFTSSCVKWPYSSYGPPTSSPLADHLSHCNSELGTVIALTEL